MSLTEFSGISFSLVQLLNKRSVCLAERLLLKTHFVGRVQLLNRKLWIHSLIVNIHICNKHTIRGSINNRAGQKFNVSGRLFLGGRERRNDIPIKITLIRIQSRRNTSTSVPNMQRIPFQFLDFICIALFENIVTLKRRTLHPCQSANNRIADPVLSLPVE
jgi:hypothetical protein